MDEPRKPPGTSPTMPSLAAVAPPAPVLADEAPTPRISVQTPVFLTITQELLARIGERPGC